MDWNYLLMRNGDDDGDKRRKETQRVGEILAKSEERKTERSLVWGDSDWFDVAHHGTIQVRLNFQ